MRRSDIHPGTEYEVKQTIGRYQRSKIPVRARVIALTDGHVACQALSAKGLGGELFEATPRDVVQPWIEVEHHHALIEDSNRTWRKVYDAERAAKAASVRIWASAFSGIMVPDRGSRRGPPTYQDLEQQLNRAFGEDQCGSLTAREGLFQAISDELVRLQGLLADKAAGWGAPTEPIPEPERVLVIDVSGPDA